MRHRPARDSPYPAPEADGAAEATGRDTTLTRLWPLLGRTVAFHRRLVDLTGNVKAALLLSQSLYWTRHGRDIARAQGWFYKTAAQWELELGLSAREQAHARDILRGLDLIAEQRIGVPARLHFRVGVERMAQLLGARGFPGGTGDITGLTLSSLARILGPAIAYHRCLADVAGGVHPGMLLSRALYLTRRQQPIARDGWFTRTGAQWRADLGLSRREQELARQVLRVLGIWEESSRGMPPQAHIRVNLDHLLCHLERITATAISVSSEPRSADCGDATNSPARNVESSLRESRTLDSTKPPFQFRQKRHSRFDETATPHIRVSTGSLLQHQSGLHGLVEKPPRGGGEWIYPAALLPEERAIAATLLAPYPELAQVLLDELAGRLDRQSVRVSPIGYLRGMLQKLQAGAFLPELAPRVVSARERVAREAAEREERRSAASREALHRQDPAHRLAVDAHRATLKKLLASRRSAANTDADLTHPDPSTGTVSTANNDPLTPTSHPVLNPGDLNGRQQRS